MYRYVSPGSTLLHAELALCRLSDAPAAGEVIRLRATVLNLPGSAVRASDAVAVSSRELRFTAANYTNNGAGLLSVNRTGAGPPC